MSYIFDALQRSQAERSEAEKSGAVPAIALLEKSEREVAAHWNAEKPSDQVAATGAERPGPVLSGEGFGPGAAETDPTTITRMLRKEQRRETFGHFQTLKLSEAKSPRLACLGNQEGPVTDAFHVLGVRLRGLQKERPLKRLLITSTVPQEGKSVVTSNLACTLGCGEHQRVLLIDGDMRRPTQSLIFGLDKMPGLYNYLQGNRSLTSCIYHLPEAGIWIMPAGENLGNSAELMQSPQVPKMMEKLSSWFDWVIIDSPPALPLVDTSVWARLADGVLLVARQGTTRKRTLQRGLEALNHSQLIGVVLNASTGAVDKDYYYYRDSPEEQNTRMPIAI